MALEPIHIPPNKNAHFCTINNNWILFFLTHNSWPLVRLLSHTTFGWKCKILTNALPSFQAFSDLEHWVSSRASSSHEPAGRQKMMATPQKNFSLIQNGGTILNHNSLKKTRLKRLPRQWVRKPSFFSSAFYRDSGRESLAMAADHHHPACNNAKTPKRERAPETFPLSVWL